jgi:type IX secretion system PorP/SprF family membrane protein
MSEHGVFIANRAWSPVSDGTITQTDLHKLPNMQKGIFIFVALLVWQQASAQLQPNATHFTYNRLFYNPATAGQNTVSTVQALYREQWLGFEGAPRTGIVSWQNAIQGDHIGIGGNFMYNEIGIHKRIHADFAYNYRANMLNGILSAGLQFSYRHLQQNWADPRLVGSQSLVLDQAIPAVQSSRMMPNFGAGIFFEQNQYYIGLSVPRMLENSIDFTELGGQLSREPQHFYAMGGFTHMLSNQLSMSYHLLGNYVKSQPFDLDLNAMVHYNQRINAGINYSFGGDQMNSGESLDVLAGVQVNGNLAVSAAYDFSLGRLQKYSGGSIEVAVIYTIKPASPLFGQFIKVKEIKPASN